jgi:hypothetical protein
MTENESELLMASAVRAGMRVAAFAAAHAPEPQLRVVNPRVMDRDGGSRLRVFLGDVEVARDRTLQNDHRAFAGVESEM